MKHLLLTTIAAVVLVGCGESQPPEPPDISIHRAARDGNIEAVKQHLADGADVNAKLDRGYTALHYAAHEGHKEIAQLLIAAGADVNAKGEGRRGGGGMTPLDLAVKFHKPETVALLSLHGGKTGEELKAEGK